MDICLITREEICTYSVKENLSCYHFNTLLLRTLMGIHFIISHHPCHYLCIHDILFHAHTYRNHPLGVRSRGGGESGDTQPVAPEGEEQAPEELPKCPDN